LDSLFHEITEEPFVLHPVITRGTGRWWVRVRTDYNTAGKNVHCSPTVHNCNAQVAVTVSWKFDIYWRL